MNDKLGREYLSNQPSIQAAAASSAAVVGAKLPLGELYLVGCRKESPPQLPLFRSILSKILLLGKQKLFYSELKFATLVISKLLAKLDPLCLGHF